MSTQVPPSSFGPGKPKPGSLHAINPIRVALFGRPLKTDDQEHGQMRKLIALPIFSSDAISSVAYASQEILLVLGTAGLWSLQNAVTYTQLTLGVTCSIAILLAIVVSSYWQTIFAYPGGGGSYIVSKENLGTYPGLIAGAALLIDYVLTVAVSVAAGVQQFVSTPFAQHLAQSLGIHDYSVLLCVLCIAGITLVNLRGVKEAGLPFAIPCYFFVMMLGVMLGLGLFGTHLGWQVNQADIHAEYERAKAHLPDQRITLSGVMLLGLVLRAFANGCSAMTGTEAISNAVPGFRKPQALNAGLTLIAMGVILSCLFFGISTLASSLHVVYVHYYDETARATLSSPAVIEQLSRAVFGAEGVAWWRITLYYCTQFATVLILILAANTSFAGFPRLAAILARDRFMPRQLANQGDKLVFSNGIGLLALFAITLIVAFHGNVDHMIPLYSIGVFTAFTLSQSGMVVHWRKERGRMWHGKALINGVGAVVTGIVMFVIAFEKWHEGAWIIVFVMAAQIAIFVTISRHYERIRRKLSIINWRPDPAPLNNTVILLIPSLHRGVFPAIKYARSISPDCRAIHIETDPNDTPRLRREWEEYVGEDIPLVILTSPYRSLIGPMLAYLSAVQNERAQHMITVVLPEFVPGKWWHSVLHNANGLLVKVYLSQRRNVAVTNIRYFLDDDEPARKSRLSFKNGTR